MPKFTLSVLAMSMGMAGAVYAEQPVEHLTVTANRMPQNINRPLADIDVISAADIERLQPYSVIDLLSSVAGVDITRDGGIGQSASLFMRGTNSNHTLILVNGMRVGSASLGYQSLSTLPIGQISRVEVVRGPRAALYGADAIGGVIQIFTRGYTPHNGVDAALKAGSHQYYQAELGAGFDNDTVYGGIAFGQQGTDGYNVQPAAQDDDDGNLMRSVTANAALNLGDATRLQGSMMATDGRYDYDYDPTFGGQDKTRFKNYAWRTDLEQRFDWGSVGAWFGQNRDFERYYGNGVSEHQGSYYETKRQLAGAKGVFTIGDAMATALGWDWYEEQLSPDEQFTDAKRHNNGFYAVTSGRWQALTSELALRYDDNNAFGDETTYNVAVGYQIADWRLSASQGTGFKAPSFNDLFSPYGGNSELDAEKSRSREIAIEGNALATHWRLSAYRTDIDHLISWSPDDELGYSYSAKNIDKAKIKGAELSADFALATIQNKVWASYVDARDKSDDSRLIRRARKQFRWDASWQHNDWQLGTIFHFAGNRPSGQGYDLPSYALWDLNGRYQLNSSVALHARLANAFDKQYQSNVGYDAPGREIYLGVTMRL